MTAQSDELCKPKQQHQSHCLQPACQRYRSFIYDPVQHTCQLVSIDAKQSDAIKLRKFWDENGQKRDCIHNEVILVIPGIETGQEKPKTMPHSNTLLLTHQIMLITIVVSMR